MIISQLLGKAGFFPSPCFLILVDKQIPVPWFIRAEVSHSCLYSLLFARLAQE